MCAILGLGLFRGHTFKNDDKAMLRDLFDEMFRNAELSGPKATGVAISQEKRISVLKKAMKSTLFVQRNDYKELFEEHLDLESKNNRTLSILGHCRYPTKGSENNNNNNHPIVANHIIGIHNGMISNDDSIFSRWRGIFTRDAEVDTEIIFKLLAHFTTVGAASGHPVYTSAQAIKNTVSTLTGSLACAAVNARKPYSLYLFRKDTPIRIRYWPESKLLLFATRESIIEDAVDLIYDNRVEFNRSTEIEILPHTGMIFNLHNNVYSSFPVTFSAAGRS